VLDISLHLLDIMQNCAHAGATKVGVEIVEDPARDLLKVTVTDNGSGMDESGAKKAMDPFYSSSNKRVGLGLPLIAQAAAVAGGTLSVNSVPGKGTTVTVVFRLSHIDRQPVGDLAATAVSFLAGNSGVELSVGYRGPSGKAFSMDTGRDYPLSKREALGQIGFLSAVEENLRDGLAQAGFSPDGGGVDFEVD